MLDQFIEMVVTTGGVHIPDAIDGPLDAGLWRPRYGEEAV